MTQQLTMEIGGMTCGHCVAAVTGALKGLDGVTVEQVSVGRARVAYDADATTPDRIAQAVEDEGYRVVATG